MKTLRLSLLFKLSFCDNATKFNLRFVQCSASQIYGGDFTKLCGVLRIYKLYRKLSLEQIC